MPYSRWSYSIWYTFWKSAEPDLKFKLPTKTLKYAQTFEICDRYPYFISYGEIQQMNMKTIIQNVGKFYKKHDKNVSADELNELVDYLRQFEEEINDYFKWSNFFYYEWYLPIKNKLFKLK